MKKCNDDASTGYLAYYLIAIVFGIFLYVAVGPVFDLLVNILNSQITGGGFPISMDRVNAINFLIILVRAFRFLAIILPLILYGIIVTIREKSDTI